MDANWKETVPWPPEQHKRVCNLTLPWGCSGVLFFSFEMAVSLRKVDSKKGCVKHPRQIAPSIGIVRSLGWFRIPTQPGLGADVDLQWWGTRIGNQWSVSP